MLLTRTRQVFDYLSLLNEMKKNHGVNFTVAWMKACYVALQKSLGSDNLKTLRELDPDLPMPRLINGVPAIIKSKDRDQIRRGNPKVIIFWSSLFSIYRVLAVSYKLKFSTITDPFKGDRAEFDKILKYSFLPFWNLEGFNSLVKSHNLAPTRLPLLRAASATNSVSWHGLFTDAVGWFSSEKMFPILQDYYLGIQSCGWNTMWVEEKVLEMSEIGSILSSKKALRSKCSMVGWFGQFSLKEEAAGKLRIFAIVDSISQMMLLPLHDFMLKTLRMIPNDGTFNQDESVKRSKDKAILANKAYSFDLSAATDRLPVELTEFILSLIFTKRFAGSWRRFMVERPFFFNSKTIEKYSVPDKEYYYSVGQPMGALSSWPALALTHHWILQYCSNVVLGRRGWELAYEILGDDLVVFDYDLAMAYLKICKTLGVDINLNKSIQSHNRPVFEFAKRTCWGPLDVSPISMKQLMANDSLSERITNVLSFLKRGLLVKKSILGALISKVGDSSILDKPDKIFTPILSILGGLRNYIPHRWLVEPLINPIEDFEFEDSRGEIPLQQIINLILKFNRSWVCPDSYPFSNEDLRKEIYDDYEPEFANVIANTALTQLKVLQNTLQTTIRVNSRELVAPYALFDVWVKDHPNEAYNQADFLDSLTLSQIEGWFDDLLFEDGKFDVDQAIEDFESFKPFYYRRLTLEDSENLQQKVQSFLFHFNLSPKEHNVESREDEAKVMRMIDKVISNRPSAYFKLPIKEWELVN